jgi:hypothetical protein
VRVRQAAPHSLGPLLRRPDRPHETPLGKRDDLRQGHPGHGLHGETPPPAAHARRLSSVAPHPCTIVSTVSCLRGSASRVWRAVERLSGASGPRRPRRSTSR